ncbi:MAG TPA: isochorismatase family cysteine hydrolase [Spirochaetota bacterium]|nr:isochorismatase family cysteine hydrolase [Spirochaetota bacterium]HOL56308.1 isochorismatase family cysteine hydrolase [Spirochaetota bacterium]HPP03347.1 isochorismatase family cysteine hydrolase [Spirochaetota bacterium]
MIDKKWGLPALFVVDMQNYYFKKESSFNKLSNFFSGEDSLKYISDRCQNLLIPNIKKLQTFFRKNNYPVIFLRLCGKKKDRSDLHRFFKNHNDKGEKLGLYNVYPLEDDPMSFVLDEIKPLENEIIFCKTTFSAFNSTNINEYLKKNNISYIFFTGIATSQCVETTARDASDYGYSVIHIDDAQGDYYEYIHKLSLESSYSLCGGWIFNTNFVLKNFDSIIKDIYSSERNLE